MMSLRKHNSTNTLSATNMSNKNDNTIKRIASRSGIGGMRQLKKLRSMPSIASPFNAFAKQCKAVVSVVKMSPLSSSLYREQRESSHSDRSHQQEDCRSAQQQDMDLIEQDLLEDRIDEPRVVSGLEQLITAQIIAERILQGSDDDDTHKVVASLRRDFVARVRNYLQGEFTEHMLFLCDTNAMLGIQSNPDIDGEPQTHLDVAIACSSEQAQSFFLTAQYLMERTKGSSTRSFAILTGLLVLVQVSIEGLIEPHILFSLAANDTELKGHDRKKTHMEDAARIVSWIHNYLNLANEYGGGVLLKSVALTNHAEKLFEMYLRQGVVGSMKFFLERSMKLRVESDITTTKNGQLITGYQAEIAYMFNMQLKIAKEKLPKQYWGRVVAACNQEFRVVVGQSMMQMGTLWRDMTVERLCSVINDTIQLSYQCEDRNDEYPSNNSDGHDLCVELAEYAIFTVHQLCERIMLDLEDSEPSLTTIGNGATWEDPDAYSAVKRTNATLKDYLEDLEHWLDPSFYVKVLKRLFDISVERYTASFFGNSMAGRVTSAGAAAAAMRRDYDEFVMYWSQYFEVSGFYSKSNIHQRLSLILSVHRIMRPDLQPEDVQGEMEIVFVELGLETGIPVVLHLVGLRGKQDTTVSLRWHETLSKVNAVVISEEVESEVPKGCEEKAAAHKYSLPDVRNSPFLCNVQLPRGRQLNRLRRGKSIAEGLDISGTTVLVKGRKVQRVRQKVGQGVRGLRDVRRRLANRSCNVE